MSKFKKEQYRPCLIPNDTDLLMSVQPPERIWYLFEGAKDLSFLLSANDDEWGMFLMLYPQLIRPALELQINAWNMWGREVGGAHYWVSKSGHIW